jgi:cell division protein FtsB
MIPFQERKKLRKILYAKATLLVLLVVLIFVVRGTYQVYQKAHIARTEQKEVEKSFEELALHANELEQSVERLKSEQGIEGEIRQKFTVARPGEEVVVIVDESTKKSKNGESKENQSFWQKLLVLWQ